MDKQKLLEIIKTGEGYTSEFKDSFNASSGKELGKAICAFANASGGKIILGASDNDSIKGFSLTNEHRSRIHTIARDMDPSFQVTIDKVSNLAVIYVPEGKEKPYAFSGRFYLRQGSNSQQLKRNEIQRFFQKANLIRFDRKANQDFDIEKDFNNQKFKDFLSRAQISRSLQKDHILKNLNLITEGKLNNAGVLFFSHKISKFFLNSIVGCVLYASSTKLKILDKTEFDADFVSNFNNAVVFALRNLRTEYIIKKIEREEKPEVPEEVLRELIINAMIHRDYFSEGRVLIEIFSDRVEISNPGDSLSKKEDFGKTSISRNPLLVDMVQRLKFVEKIGSGINRVKHTLKRRVRFEISADWFRVIIKRDVTENVTKNLTGKSLSDTVNVTENNIERKIIIEMQKKPHITYDELEKRVGKSRRTITRHVEKLKKRGIVKRLGSDKKGRWEVVR